LSAEEQTIVARLVPVIYPGGERRASDRPPIHRQAIVAERRLTLMAVFL
jgi:hypothetical protein